MENLKYPCQVFLLHPVRETISKETIKSPRVCFTSFYTFFFLIFSLTFEVVTNFTDWKLEILFDKSNNSSSIIFTHKIKVVMTCFHMEEKKHATPSLHASLLSYLWPHNFYSSHLSIFCINSVGRWLVGD